MGPDGDDRLGEVDQLLQELLPAEGGKSDAVAQWQVTEVPTDVPTEVVAEVAAENRPPPAIHTPPVEPEAKSSGRIMIWLVAAGLVLALAVGIGYWLAADRGEDTATPESERAVDTTAAAPSSTVDDQGATDDPADAPVDVGSVDALQSELRALDLSQIGFVSGTDELTPDSQGVIADLGALLISQPSIPVQVQVATFTQATPGQNHGLSTGQAESLTRALIAEGVSPDRLASTGRGSSARVLRVGDNALLFDTDDVGLAAELTNIDSAGFALVAEESLTAEAAESLDLVSDAMVRNPEASLTLIAHANAGSAAASHDVSHVVLDEAVAHLSGLGVDPARLSTVGMGEAPLDIDLETKVDLDIGPAAAIAVAVAQIDTDRISFRSGTDELTPESAEALAQVASALAIDPSIKIEISAHTYTEASSEENHDLSHDQGDAVVDALIEVGVAPDRLGVTGHGDPSHFAVPGRESFIRFDPVG